MRNWAGNITYSTDRLQQPRSVEELQEAVASATQVRALGSGHSFNDLIDCAGTLISTRQLPMAIRVDVDKSEVEVPGSATYAELGAALHAEGLALPNMGSLPHRCRKSPPRPASRRARSTITSRARRISRSRW